MQHILKGHFREKPLSGYYMLTTHKQSEVSHLVPDFKFQEDPSKVSWLCSPWLWPALVAMIDTQFLRGRA